MYLEKFKLDRKTALVTGGGQGIGLACAEALAEAGAKVFIADRDQKAAEAGRAALQAKGHDAEIVIMDVTDPTRVTEVADQLASQHGKIDILVNNAGIARSETPAETVADEHWLNVIDVNLNGTFWCCRAFGRHMLAAKSGAIVNIVNAVELKLSPDQSSEVVGQTGPGSGETDHGADGLGQDGQAGLERGVAQDMLQKERAEEEHPEQGRAQEGLDEVGARSVAVGEHPQRGERMGGAAFDGDERGEPE